MQKLRVLQGLSVPLLLAVLGLQAGPGPCDFCW